MQQYADQIHDAGLREKADTVVSLDDKMQQSQQSRQVGQALQAACPT